MELFNSLLRRSVSTVNSSYIADGQFIPSSSSSPVVGVSLNTVRSRVMSRSSESTASGGRSPRPFHLTDLPEVPLDKVISYLEDEDLRRFHQVSSSWKSALESRSRDDLRRQELVKRIRENKENIRSGTLVSQELVPLAVAQRTIRERSSSDSLEGKKTGTSFILMECTNQVVETNTPTSVNNTPVLSTPVDSINFLTPEMTPFEFQEFQKAERSLEPGQKLLKCGRCRGPVPSPATPVMDSQEIQESRRVSSQSTRCKLVERLDDYHHNSHLESPRKQKSKKAKTLSTVDLSPIPYAPPVTVASLGEQMFHSLALSTPCLTTITSSTCTSSLPPSSPQGFAVKRSTSCNSITGIDLPHQFSGDVGSPIDLSVNMSMDNSPFFASNPSSHYHYHNQFGSVDLNDSSLNCSRSCCSPRRVQNNSQMHTSHFSDSGLSFEDSVDEFSNMILSPAVPATPAGAFFDEPNNNTSNSNRYSIERARDFSNYSDRALSLSSYSHLQRSDHSLNFSSFDNNNESEFLNVLECPNPKCRFRFCSNCEESEHPGRSCHLLSSDQFESFSFENNRHSIGSDSNNSSRDNINSNISNINSSNSKSSSNKKSNNNSSKNSKHKNPKKTPLRRLARL